MAKRKAAPKYVWVARCMGRADLEWCGYELWTSKPQLFGSSWMKGEYDTTGHQGYYCAEMFERMTGITLEPGTCRRFAWRSPLVAIEKKRKVKA